MFHPCDMSDSQTLWNRKVVFGRSSRKHQKTTFKTFQNSKKRQQYDNTQLAKLLPSEPTIDSRSHRRGIAAVHRQPQGCVEPSMRMARRSGGSLGFGSDRSGSSHCGAPELLRPGDLLPRIWHRCCIEGRVKRWEGISECQSFEVGMFICQV